MLSTPVAGRSCAFMQIVTSYIESKYFLYGHLHSSTVININESNMKILYITELAQVNYDQCNDRPS